VSGCVVDHRPVHDVGESAFEQAHGLVRGLPAGFAAVEEGAALGGVAQLDRGHDVQHPVDLSVATSGQSVADVVSRGCVDECGAGLGAEVVWCVVEEVKSGSWAIAGNPLTTGDVRALAAGVTM
jgi:phenylpyruvate tautomerase PptA (4-oxalocrotonate tautomerase family)